MTAQRDEDRLDDLLGTLVPSETTPGVAYRLVSHMGIGEFFTSFYAIRTAPDGDCPVVMKMLRPSFSRRLGQAAAIVVKKEAVSLSRLNERVPPTPYVVRLVDTGTFTVEGQRHTQSLPWITIELVHGGPAGTTLRERVQRSIETFGFAFDPARAMRAIASIAGGLAAVHEVGVIHRDLTPDSILCYGTRDDEIMKLSDFGLARPVGVEETFGLGFDLMRAAEIRAPELLLQNRPVGPWTDMFGFACVIYFLLTGEQLIVARPEDGLLSVLESRSRRSVLEARWLHPEIRAHESVCHSIDFALRWATAPREEERLQEAESLAAMLIPYLRPAVEPAMLSQPRPSAAPRPEPTGPGVEIEAEIESIPRGARIPLGFTEVRGAPPRVQSDRWAWTTLRHPGVDGTLRCVAWDGYGRCLAATSKGLLFWNGMAWCAMESSELPEPHGIHFVHKVGSGRWLVGGDGSMLAAYTTGGLAGVIQLPGSVERYIAMSGDAGDMGVLAAVPEQGPVHLRAFIGKRWLRPCAVGGLAHLAAFARVEDERWLLAGRSSDGKGVLALYSPLDWQHERLPAPEVRAFNACAGAPESDLGIAVGTNGAVVWWRAGRAVAETLDPDANLSAVALGADGSVWVASAGRIWRRATAVPEAGGWECVWTSEEWFAPMVSLFIDSGVVVAVTADGGVLEGRARS